MKKIHVCEYAIILSHSLRSFLYYVSVYPCNRIRMHIKIQMTIKKRQMKFMLRFHAMSYYK